VTLNKLLFQVTNEIEPSKKILLLVAHTFYLRSEVIRRTIYLNILPYKHIIVINIIESLKLKLLEALASNKNQSEIEQIFDYIYKCFDYCIRDIKHDITYKIPTKAALLLCFDQQCTKISHSLGLPSEYLLNLCDIIMGTNQYFYLHSLENDYDIDNTIKYYLSVFIKDVLESGQCHVYRGVLGVKGLTILDIFNDLVSQNVKNGIYSLNESIRITTNLKKMMKKVG
jgi:hypothetical protein